MDQPRKDGRDAASPYRVRADGVWYWADPRFPRDEIEAGDTVVVYPVNGDAVVAILQGQETGAMTFTSPQGETFDVDPRDIAVMHLATVDEGK